MAAKSDFYTIDEAAKYVGLSKRFMYQLNHYKAGPKFTKGRRNQLFYAKADLDSWLAAREAKKKAAEAKRVAKKGGKGQRVVRNYEKKLKKAA